MNNFVAEYGKLLSQFNFGEAKEYRKNSISKTLNKFYSLSDDSELNKKKFETLEKEQIWLSATSEMNDPYDFSEMYIDEKELQDAYYPLEMIESFEQYLNSFKDNYALTSLTKNSYNSLPMWAYYANNSKGFCVEYEVINPDKIFPIIYEQKRIPIASTMAEIYKNFCDLSYGKGEITQKTVLYVHLLILQMLIKHKSWAHEKEFRIIYPNELNTLGFSISNDFVGLKVKRIICGINCSSDNIKKLNEISNKLGCGNILETKLSKTEYTILEEAING